MNFLKWIGLVLTKEAKDIYELGEEYVIHSLRLLYVAIGIPAVMLALGVIIGAIGDNAGIAMMVTAAHWLLAISGFLAALLLTLFWVRAVVFTNLIVAATTGVSLLWDDAPKLERDNAEAFLRWLRGVTLWITAVALYAQIVPVWSNLWLSLLVGTCVLIFSAMMSARWFDGKWAQRGLLAAVLCIFAVSTVSLVSPGFARSVRTTLDRHFAQADAWNDRHDQLDAVDTAASRHATEIDADLLRRFTARRNQLRRRAVEVCNGDFCSAAERREYAELGQRIDRIRAGTYWDHEAAPAHGSGDVPPPSSSPDRRGSSASSLPPPPGPVHHGPRTTPSASHRSGDALHRLSRADLDDIFRELHKYPDL